MKTSLITLGEAGLMSNVSPLVRQGLWHQCMEIVPPVATPKQLLVLGGKA